MFGIGGFELFIILIFGFLIFGPDKLPDIAKTVGKGIARFRQAQQEVNEAIGDEKLIDFDDPDQPIKDPMEALDRIAQRHEEKRAQAKEAEAPVAAAGDAGKGGEGAGYGADEGAGEAEPKQESFTERKARYERERAARKAAEAEAAKKAAEQPAAAGDAAEPAADGTAGDAGADTDAPAEAAPEGGDA